MNTLARTMLVTGALAGGGAVAAVAFGVPGVATAQAPAGDEATDSERRSGPLRTALDALVADGTITQDQADTVTERVRSEARERGDDPGRRGRGRGRAHLRELLGTAAETIGVSEDDLRSALGDGQTLAEVAEANGVERQALVDALAAAADEQFSEDLPERIERLVDAERGD
ncbi:MAG: hypothetical protein H0U26_08960 [Acidimicrobiia bacterium]|nr:hypothetical protein [Acidimicrobiia bacterium]